MKEKIVIPGLLGNIKSFARQAMEADESLTRRDAIKGSWRFAVRKTANDLKKIDPVTKQRIYTEIEREAYLAELVNHAFRPITKADFRVSRALGVLK